MTRDGGYGRIGYLKGEHPRNNISSFIIDNAKKKPDRKALLWLPEADYERAGKGIVKDLEHRFLSFSEFNDKVNRLTTGLKSLGISKGDRVIIFIPMSPELYQCINAVMRIGAVSVFLDPWATPERLGLSAGLVKPLAMISSEMAFDFCQVIPELAEIPVKIVVGPHERAFTGDYPSLVRQEPDFEVAAVHRDHTALITFTTGSSGIPKGADRTHGFLAAQHYAIDSVLPYKDDDIDISAFPIFCLNNLAAGVTTVLPAARVGQLAPCDNIRIASQILSCDVSCATLSIPMVEEMNVYAREKGLVLPRIRRAVTGGAPISNRLLEEFLGVIPHAEFLVLYGSTEAEPMAHIEARKKIREERAHAGMDAGVNAGYMVENLDVKFAKINKGRIVLGKEGWEPLEVSPGDVGELLVSGPHVCQKYYNNEDALKDNKVIDSNGKVWHRTGDLARMDEKNQLWVVGRLHNVIVRENRYYYPVNVEILLKQIDFVDKAAFIGIPDDYLGEKTCVVVSPKDSMAEVAKKQGIEIIEKTLRPFRIPVDGIAIADDIPLDPRHHSKVEYGVLRKQVLEGNITLHSCA